MEPGDLIRWRGQVWLVRKVDPDLATAVVEADRNMEVIPSDADSTGDCQVWCKPSQQWPSVRLPFLAGAIRLVRVRRGWDTLRRFIDWVKLDDFQIGGALYLNPALNLGFGDRLVAVYEDPSGDVIAVPIDIPRNFTPLPERRQVVSEVVPPAPVVELGPEPKTTPMLFARLRKRTE